MRKLLVCSGLIFLLFPLALPAAGPEGEDQSPSFYVGSFNLEKLRPERLLDTLGCKYMQRILENFAILAIQGLQAPDQAFLSRWLKKLGPEWQGLLGPVLGVPGFKEQLAFLWKSSLLLPDSSRLTVTKTLDYRVEEKDQKDLPMNVMPLCQGFRVEGSPAGNRSDFILVNIKVQDCCVKDELAYLKKLIPKLRKVFAPEKDVIFLGNFNASRKVLQEKLKLAAALDPDAVTDLSSGQGEDNILWDAKAGGQEFDPVGEVFKVPEELNLSPVQALEFNAHQPVFVLLKQPDR